MASASWKDAIKALEDAFAAPTVPSPLPEELQQDIDAFLEKINELDDVDTQRLHEHMLACYNEHVRDYPEKQGPFLKTFRQLRPAITGDSRLEEWWSLVLRPVIDGAGHKRDDVEDARAIVLDILASESGEGNAEEKATIAAVFTQRLLECYIHRTRIPTGEDDKISPEDELIAREVESLLVEFGRKKPKELLTALNDLFVQAKYRAQALSLLSTFVRIQPPHLYLVLETPLVQNLEKCMMIDDSATVVELALTVLIMFLPHITGSLVPHLPHLFLIYSRILCWDQVTAAASEEQPGLDEPSGEDDSENDSDNGSDDSNWEKLKHTFDHPETSAPGALYYFTFLYGLFPINFMNYIRKPRKYLKSISYPDADDFMLDQDAIRRRTEPFRQVHLLHPNFFNTTAEDELSESRFLKSDPADVVTDCMSLCMSVSASLDDPGPPPTAKLPEIPAAFVPIEDIPVAALDDDTAVANSTATLIDAKSPSWRNTQSTLITSPSKESFSLPRKTSHVGSPAARPLDASLDSPTLPGQPVPDEADKAPSKSRQALRKDSDASTGFNVLASPRLDAFAQAMSSNQVLDSSTNIRLAQNLATLQREVMLLRNDLNFERYLKNQHLSHIGQLQRRHIKESTMEAETQNLINTNRTLKAKLQKANALYAQLKKETMTGRNQSKKWEGELSTKLKSFRDESKTWHAEEESLRSNLQKAQKDNERLRRLIVESEARELNSRQNLLSIQTDMEGMDELRQEIETLQKKLREFELKELSFEQAKEDQERLRNELKMARMKLDSRDADHSRMAKAYDRKFAEFEAERSHPVPATGNPNQLSQSVQQMIDSALAASNSKYHQLRKTHNRLLHRFTELEMHCQALEGELAYARGRPPGTRHRDMSPSSPIDEASSGSFIRPSGGDNTPSGRMSSFAARSLQHPRAFSDPLRSDDDFTEDDYNEYPYPASSLAPSSTYTGRPERAESLPTRSLHGEPVSPTSLSASPTEAFPPPRFYSFNATEPLHPSDGKSTFSSDSGNSRGDRQQPTKIQPKSEMRIYGRGGAQNIGKKKHGADKKEPPRSGSGGFRGFRGLMSQN